MTDQRPPPSYRTPGKHAFGKLLGMRMDSTAEGVCRMHLEAREEHYNPHGVMHGGVMFSLADTSMGAALYPLLDEGETCATVEMKINFLKPVTRGQVSCETTVLRRGKTTAVMESHLRVNGDLVGVALGTYAIFPMPPAP